MNNIILELVKSLDQVEFEMTPEQTEQLKTRIADSRLQNVRSYFGRSWAVQMRIAGSAWTLGVTKKLHVAARFSDMCHLYFTQLGARNFRSEEFNFDRATAEADLAHPTAGPLLGELTSVIFPSGVPAKPVKAKRTTLRSELAQLRHCIFVLFLWSDPDLRRSAAGRRLQIDLLGPDATPEDVTGEVEEMLETAEDSSLTDRELIRELQKEIWELQHFMSTGKFVDFDTMIAAAKEKQ